MFLAKPCVLSIALLCLVQLMFLMRRSDGAPTISKKTLLALALASRRFGYNNYNPYRYNNYSPNKYNNYYPRRYYSNYNNGYYNNYPSYYSNPYRSGNYNSYNSGHKGIHG